MHKGQSVSKEFDLLNEKKTQPNQPTDQKTPQNRKTNKKTNKKGIFKDIRIDVRTFNQISYVKAAVVSLVKWGHIVWGSKRKKDIKKDS